MFVIWSPIPVYECLRHHGFADILFLGIDMEYLILYADAIYVIFRALHISLYAQIDATYVPFTGLLFAVAEILVLWLWRQSSYTYFRYSISTHGWIYNVSFYVTESLFFITVILYVEMHQTVMDNINIWNLI